MAAEATEVCRSLLWPRFRSRQDLRLKAVTNENSGNWKLTDVDPGQGHSPILLMVQKSGDFKPALISETLWKMGYSPYWCKNFFHHRSGFLCVTLTDWIITLVHPVLFACCRVFDIFQQHWTYPPKNLRKPYRPHPREVLEKVFKTCVLAKNPLDWHGSPYKMGP